MAKRQNPKRDERPLGVSVQAVTAIRSLVNWAGGPLVEIQISGEPPAACQHHHRPAWRSIFRLPPRRIPAAAESYDGANRAYTSLIARLETLIEARRGAKKKSAAGAEPQYLAPSDPRVRRHVKATRHALRLLGYALYDFAIDPAIGKELKMNGVYLEIGTDKSLSHLPWELINDLPYDPTGREDPGDDTNDEHGYYCLKHFVGRFVDNAKTAPPEDYQWRSEAPEDLVVALIIVPWSGSDYDPLPGAEKEMKAIMEALKPLKLPPGSLRVLYGEQATKDNVRNLLFYEDDKRKHIIHFCGHGYFNPKDPSNSNLRLYDGQSLGTDQIVSYFSRAKPILCFINACNSAKHAFVPPPSPASLLDQDRYNLYGLGKAFLDTGTYLLGANWEIEDRAAMTFAGSFYDSLLVKGLSLGESVRNARIACRKLNLSDFAWASYVLYGDPRVQFQIASPRKVTSFVRVRVSGPISESGG
jgi:CHAT domain